METTVTQESLIKHSIKNIGICFIYNARLIAVLAFLVAFLVPVTAKAALYDGPDADHEDHGLWQLLCWEFETVTGARLNDDVAGKVAVNLSDGALVIGGETIEGAGGILKGVNDTAILIAQVILGITFCLSLSNLRNFGDFGYEFFKKLIIFAVGMFLISWSMSACFTIANTSTNIANSIASPSTATDVTAQVTAAEKKLYDVTHILELNSGFAIDKLINTITGLFRGIFLITPFISYFLIPLIGSLIAMGIVWVTVWGRAIEIALLAALSPIAFSDLVGENFGGGAGARFFKNFAALCLSGMIILIVLSLCGNIISNQLNDALSSFDPMNFIDASFGIVFMQLARAGLVMKSTQIAKTAFGLN